MQQIQIRDNIYTTSETINAIICVCTVSPKAVVTVRPDERVFRGETVTLRCDIKWAGDTEWTYRWEIEGTNNWDRNSASRCTEQHCCTGADKQTHRNAVSRCSTQELIISSVDLFHSGQYSCRGERSDSQRSRISDAVTLNVSGKCVCECVCDQLLHQFLYGSVTRDVLFS